MADIKDNISESSGDEEIVNSKVRTNISRGEKKARKALLKLGLTHVEGVNRATIKVQRTLLVLQRPDVYKTPSGESFVVFGDMTPQDLGAAMQQFLRAAAQTQASAAPAGAAPAAGEKAAAEYSEEDISLIMEQGQVSREKAIEALTKAGGDPVDAIMHLQG